MQDDFKEEQLILHLTSFYQASLEPAGDTSYGFLSFMELPAICPLLCFSRTRASLGGLWHTAQTPQKQTAAR